MNFNFIFVVVILHSFVAVVVAGLKRCIIIFLFFLNVGKGWFAGY